MNSILDISSLNFLRNIFFGNVKILLQIQKRVSGERSGPEDMKLEVNCSRWYMKT